MGKISTGIEAIDTKKSMKREVLGQNYRNEIEIEVANAYQPNQKPRFQAWLPQGS